MQFVSTQLLPGAHKSVTLSLTMDPHAEGWYPGILGQFRELFRLWPAG